MNKSALAQKDKSRLHSTKETLGPEHKNNRQRDSKLQSHGSSTDDNPNSITENNMVQDDQHDNSRARYSIKPELDIYQNQSSIRKIEAAKLDKRRSSKQ